MSEKGSALSKPQLFDSILKRALGGMGRGESGRAADEVQQDAGQGRQTRPPVLLFQRPGSTGIRFVESTTMEMANLAARMKFKSPEEFQRFFDSYRKAGKIPATEAASPFFKAQRIIYKTVGARPKRQVKLAEKALSIYPNCADAYAILAGFEDDPEKKRELLEQACAAGKAAFEDEGIVTEEEQDLWSVLPGRSYLRAKLALANFLYEMGEKKEALSQYEEILRLNPGDNQGVRNILVGLYLELDMLKEAGEFLQERRDPFPVWDYAEAYLIYREKGDCRAARGALQRGFYKNPRIPRYLLGEERLPKRLPESSAVGSDEEAQIVSSLIIPYWRRTAGESSWTADTVDEESGFYPNPYSWLKDVIGEIRAGVWPVEALDTFAVRDRISVVWDKVLKKRPIKKGERLIAEILEKHWEFDPLFPLATLPLHKRFVIGGMDPIAHVLFHYVVEDLLSRDNDALSAELRRTLNVLGDAGLGKHEGVHLLTDVYLHQWTAAAANNEPFNAESFVWKLRFVQNVAAGGFSVVAAGGPSRNDRCLCGSGRKFKKCCGRDDSWPRDTLKALAERMNTAGGKLPFPGCPGLALTLPEDPVIHNVLAALGEDNPVIHFINAADLIRRLGEEGDTAAAALAAMRHLERAQAAKMPQFVMMMALLVLLNTMKDPFLAVLGEERAVEAVRQIQEGSEDTRSVEDFWSLIAEIRLARRDVKGAEKAIEEIRATQGEQPSQPTPSLTFLAAKILELKGRLDESRERYLELLALCDQNHGREEFDTIRPKAEKGLAQVEERLRKKVTRSRDRT